MAATTGFWNRRGVLTVSPALSQTNNCEESVDTEVVVDTISRLGVIHRKLKLPQLWSEVSIIKALVYKHSNQHRKEKYFQGLKKVVKCLNRLQDVVIFDKVADVKNKFPRLSKRGVLITETMSNCPSIEMIINLLGYLTGAAQLLLQVMSSCQETVQYSYAQMVFGYFVTFHLTCSSSLSRIWVLARSFLHNIAECYDIIFPWLNHLSEPHQLENTKAKNLPASLKTWLDAVKAGHDNNNSSSLTPSTKVLTPGTLDKLFASTPRQEPEESSPRQFTSEAESWVEPSCDLGESFISDQGCRSLERSEMLTADESLILRRKLFAENSEIAGKLHTIAEDCFTVNDATQTKKRTAEFINSTEELSGTSPKKLKTDVNACSKARSRRFLYCRKIHIYSSKRWKLCIEKSRRKLIKLRQRNARNTKDNGPKQESFATDSMNGIQNNMGHTSRRTEDKISENTAKSSQSSDSSNLPNNFSSLKQKNTKYAVRKRKGALSDDFVQRKKSSLFGNYKDTSVNSDPCRKNLESFQRKSYEETLQFGDEIDSIFNALDD